MWVTFLRLQAIGHEETISLRLRQGWRVRLHIHRKGGQHWNGLPRDAVQSPSPGELKRNVDVALRGIRSLVMAVSRSG